MGVMIIVTPSSTGQYTEKEGAVALNYFNRKQLFIKWYAWSLMFKDCDPAVWMTNYLNKRFEHNDEQRLWFCWLYGNTYHLPTAWVLLNEFPDYELATVDRMDKWNTENYKRLRYQTDTKWNKGHLPEMFESYRKFVGGNTQRDALNWYCRSAPETNFNVMWKAIKMKLHKFGRYATWFYMQHLKHTANVSVEPTSLMLADHKGSQSHRNGLLMALGKDDDYDKKLTSAGYGLLEAEAKSILQEMRGRFPQLAKDIDLFTMETCLCSFKKIFREHHGRYLGYYNDRSCEEIVRVSGDGWHGIDWEVLWQARTEMLDYRLDIKTGVNKKQFSSFVKTGTLEKLEWVEQCQNQSA